MGKDLVQDKCGLGLTILNDVVGVSVVGINVTAARNSKKRRTIYYCCSIIQNLYSYIIFHIYNLVILVHSNPCVHLVHSILGQ